MTQPLSPFKKRFRANLTKERKAQEDRAFRQNQSHYAAKGFQPKEAEEQAQMDFDVAQRLSKRKRGLKGVSLNKPDYY